MKSIISLLSVFIFTFGIFAENGFPDNLTEILEILPSQKLSRGTFYRSNFDFILCRGENFQADPPDKPVFLNAQSAGVFNNAAVDFLFAGNGSKSAMDKTEQNFRTAYEKDPQFLPFAYNYGRILQLKGEHSKAAEYFRRSASMLDQFAGSHYNRGISLLYTKDRHSAQFYFKKAYRLNRTDRRPLYALVNYFIEERSYEKANYYLNIIFSENSKDPQALALMAFMFFKKGKLPEAEKYYNAISLDTDLFENSGGDPSLIYKRAVFYEYTGEKKRALEDYRLVIEYEPILFLYGIDPVNLKKKIEDLNKIQQ